MGVRLQPQNKWTDDRRALLREIFHLGTHGWLAQEINARTGSSFTKNAIIGRCHRDGLRWTDDKERCALPLGRPHRAATMEKASTRKIRRKVRLAPMVMVAPPNEPPSLGLALGELNDSVCRYPHGDGPITFCGHPTRVESPYCGFHHRLCYRPPETRPSNAMRRAA